MTTKVPTKRELAIILEEELAKPPKRSGLSLTFPYALTASLQMKMNDSSAFHRWTAFLNNAGNLCHVISPESGILVRLKFSYPIKHLNTYEIHRKIVERIKHYVVI